LKSLDCERSKAKSHGEHGEQTHVKRKNKGAWDGDTYKKRTLIILSKSLPLHQTSEVVVKVEGYTFIS